ncbi:MULTISPECIES: hypothetical protein [Burkholderia]|uniref:hypothetical protein n=1 Tax=Burkholderia TaxID=32008 RepID=UPI001FC85AA9|nr:hypothetical protein [Burkholderia ambifaria]
MIDALIGGTVYGKPGEWTAPSGRRFVTAKMRVSVGNGDALFVNVIAFDENAKTSIAGAR